MFHVPEQFRLTDAGNPLASDSSYGNNGCFTFYARRKDSVIRVIASDGMGWEHVSVSRPDRCPSWEDMCLVKSLFWDEEDCVIQYHPPKSQYVNNHPYCLHLWRPVGIELPMPPSMMVGIKG